mmetsp:Transcript_65892/g.176086  ORF Transcript_65892/g.176086 Transcript_65892/m.176086 type:complete len:218 (+) Transcript_65892:36-689(+)
MRALLLTVLPTVQGIHPCDAENGSACPSEAGKTLGACLKDPTKHEAPTELSASCKEFIAVNDACESEIENHCSSAFYNDDTLLCLTQWTRPEQLSAECQGALPKKEEEKSEEVDADKAAWRAKRKAAREESMRQLEAEKSGTKVQACDVVSREHCSAAEIEILDEAKGKKLEVLQAELKELKARKKQTLKAGETEEVERKLKVLKKWVKHLKKKGEL